MYKPMEVYVLRSKITWFSVSSEQIKAVCSSRNKAFYFKQPHRVHTRHFLQQGKNIV